MGNSTIDSNKLADYFLLVLGGGPLFKVKNRYFCTEPFNKFILKLSSYTKLNLCTAIIKNNIYPNKISLDYKEENLSIFKIELAQSILTFYKKPHFIFKNLPILIKALKASNVIFIRICAPEGFIMFPLAKLYNKPTILYIPGDTEEIVNNGIKYKGIVKLLAILVAKFHNILIKLFSKHSNVTLVTGKILKKKFCQKSKEAYIFFVSLVKKEDIVYRKITKNNKITLLYVGRLAHEKGLNYLLSALKKLTMKNKHISLYLCGTGPEETNLKNKVNELGLNNYVRFLGFVPHGSKLDNIFIKSDIFILPSISEGIPKVLFEAMAKGLPIVATNVGGIPDIIKDKENGILVPAKSADAIVTAVELLINNTELRRSIVEGGYKFVKNYTLDKQIELIMNIVYKLTHV